MKVINQHRANTMIQVQFDGSEKELVEYVLRNRALPPRAYSQDKQRASEKLNWKARLRKIAGIWEDYDNAQDEFQNIRASFNTRISQ